MRLKLLQLNIEKGRFYQNLLWFLKKERFDILNLQELTGGYWGTASSRNYFTALKKALNLNGLLSVPQIHKNSFFGIAVFFKKSFKVLDSQEIWMKRTRRLVTPTFRPIQKFPRSFLSVLLAKNDKKIRILNTHMAWGPNPEDRAYKLTQGEKLLRYVKSITDPFILSGDFNVIPSSQTVRSLSRAAQNLTTKYNLTNTLNPRTHRIPKLFPKGLAVDYIFASRDLKIKKIRLVDEIDLSDHFGLSVKFEI